SPRGSGHICGTQMMPDAFTNTEWACWGLFGESFGQPSDHCTQKAMVAASADRTVHRAALGTILQFNRARAVGYPVLLLVPIPLGLSDVRADRPGPPPHH